MLLQGFGANNMFNTQRRKMVTSVSVVFDPE